MRVFNAMVVPTSLYECEAWTVEKRQESRLQATEIRFFLEESAGTDDARQREECGHQTMIEAGRSCGSSENQAESTEGESRWHGRGKTGKAGLQRGSD